jgi:hypothetical protein
MENETVKCSQCGTEHRKRIQNCCWISCECGASICGQCGSDNIVGMDINEDDGENQYWCCEMCNDCGLEGCGMCI